MTNLERIKSMNSEEMAVFIDIISRCGETACQDCVLSPEDCGSVKNIEEWLMKLENLSGLPLDVLINRFAKGYELTPPKNINPFEQLSDIDFNPFQALTDEEIKNIIKEKDDFFLKCFLKHGFDYEDIIANKEDFRMIVNETETGVFLYIVFYKGEVLFKIRETLVLNEETDILSNGLSFKTCLEEI